MPLSLKDVKHSEICPCAKFRFTYIFVARNIANKHFFLKKAPDPGLKHLEPALPISLQTLASVFLRLTSSTENF